MRQLMTWVLFVTMLVLVVPLAAQDKSCTDDDIEVALLALETLVMDARASQDTGDVAATLSLMEEMAATVAQTRAQCSQLAWEGEMVSGGITPISDDRLREEILEAMDHLFARQGLPWDRNAEVIATADSRSPIELGGVLDAFVRDMESVEEVAAACLVTFAGIANAFGNLGSGQ